MASKSVSVGGFVSATWLLNGSMVRRPNHTPFASGDTDGRVPEQPCVGRKVQCLHVCNFVELLVILVPRAQTIAVRRTEFNATVQVNGHFQ